VRGSAAAPQISGGFKMRNGTFSLAGTSLTFSSGEVTFDGSGRIDPTLNFVANSSNGTTTATLTITGYASAPKIALSSVPALPQDEVLAQLLFHQSASSLGPLQLAEIAAALAQISGVAGGSLDPLNSIRSGLGLDRLSVGGGGSGSSATVEAGRYVAKGVYVGAKQATSGGGTQATVQVDLTHGLKLEADVGTGGGSATGAASSTTANGTSSNGTSVGLTYQFEY
jgi:translocation and assembly module TamB